jgi:hypothetical protein
LSKRGKELLDAGDSETGYAYLQQAQGYDSSMKVPTVALRSINVNADNLTGTVRTTGEAWNPGPNAVAYMSVKTELFDTKSSQTIWSKEQKVVDEFVAPLQARETRQFELSGPLTGLQDGLELRVYLDGSLYKTYPLGAGSNGNSTASQPAAQQTRGNNASPNPYAIPPNLTPLRQSPAPGQAQPQTAPPFAPPANQSPVPAPAPGLTPEERTLKDLE